MRLKAKSINGPAAKPARRNDPVSGLKG